MLNDHLYLSIIAILKYPLYNPAFVLLPVKRCSINVPEQGIPETRTINGMSQMAIDKSEDIMVALKPIEVTGLRNWQEPGECGRGLDRETSFPFYQIIDSLGDNAGLVRQFFLTDILLFKDALQHGSSRNRIIFQVLFVHNRCKDKT